VVTVRYLGPADTADFSQIVGKPQGTEKYVFRRGEVRELSNADAEAIATEPRRTRMDADHQFELVDAPAAAQDVAPAAPRAASVIRAEVRDELSRQET
jgi:hypothetical protein